MLSALACGGDGPTGTTVVTPPDGRDGGPGGAGSGGAGNGGNGFFIDDEDAGLSGNGGCSGFGCGVTDAGPGSLCGNAVRNEGEQCDDGNAVPGDGCTGQCNLEPNFDCQLEGQACESTIACGDLSIGGSENCDDGNTESGDGCSATCSVEGGFGCRPAAGGGSQCDPVETVSCGDGVVSTGEQCDDDGTTPGDGCSADCQIELGFTCPTAGQPCSLIAFCGDGFLRDDGSEACDDGNLLPFDGCNSACALEPNFACPTPGQPCQSSIVCGDGVIQGNERCDDGPLAQGQSPVSGDGCSANCTVIEAGFSCTGGGSTVVPGPCQPVPEERCGDSALAPSEVCDDGNTDPGDGCRANCTAEPGFDCPPVAGPCVLVAICGDGNVNEERNEQCDDGGRCQGGGSAGQLCSADAGCPGGSCQTQGGDGCSANCFVEANFTCPIEGQPCVSTVVCGDGVVAGNETCDVPGIGCDDCQTETGFVCAGGVCLTTCGDGVRAGAEQCDDGGTAAGNGCGSDCRLENGFKCDDPASPPQAADVCTPTDCGDGITEGTEQCDDGAGDVPYDGCFECIREIACGDFGSGYECPEVCGDGLKFPREACDDGNGVGGDGCSAGCVLEQGFICGDAAADLGSQIDLPVLYRDFRGNHPQFEINGGGFLLPGIVDSQLGADGRPVYNPDYPDLATTEQCGGANRARTMDGPTGFDNPGNGTAACNAATLNAAQIASTFLQWYRDDPSNIPIVDVLQLTETAQGSGVFQCIDSACFGAPPGGSFFPLNGLGFGNEGRANNFHFTSEVRQAFVFDPANPPTLTFTGDDDVWVFVNGQLTVDLGGIHGPVTGSILINGLDPDDVNEVAVFQAERHVTGSNYTLTLEGFNAPITSCDPVCGDGVVTAGEACDCGDDGDPDTLDANCNAGLGNLPPGTYDACDTNCQLGPFCGDNSVQAGQGEACDNGVNSSVRRLAGTDCGAGCVTPSFCGDGSLDGAFGEECDCGNPGDPDFVGPLNPACNGGSGNAAPGTYDACDSTCQLGPSCGDGVRQAGEGEECDDGQNNGSAGSACLADCTLRCGNGTADQGEECDNGLLNNVGGYNGCNSDCTAGPACGDGFIDGSFGEECDDGLNNGDYNTCAPGCVVGPFCGDGIEQVLAGELCDDGTSNQPVGSYGGLDASLCDVRCEPLPYCGDSQVDVGLGEGCDDGVNDGSAGSCEEDCSAFVLLPACGDGAVNAGEECDTGANNGNVTSTCDVRCQTKCGNGFIDQGEQCDDGVLSGDYGTCSPGCTFSGFCGDDVVQPNSPEACDDGPGNVDSGSAYGNGVCTSQCSVAPRCGDGRVDVDFGETCDGSPSCSSACRAIQ